MAISSSADAEYLVVKAFLYKYTPKFNYVPTTDTTSSIRFNPTQTEQNTLDVFDRVTKNLQQFLVTTQQVLSNQTILQLSTPPTTQIAPPVAPGTPFVPPDSQSAIKALIDQYSVIPAGGDFLFTTNDLLISPDGKTSIQTMLQSAPNKTLAEATIATSVIDKLHLQSISPSSLINLIKVPAHPAKIPTTPPFTADFLELLQKGFPFESDIFTYTQVQAVFKAWIDHARSLQSRLNLLLKFKKQLISSRSNTEQVEKPYQVSQFSIDLDASKFFSKFDITQFVQSYTFGQSLHGNRYEWTLNCLDSVIPFTQLDSGSNLPTVRKFVKFLQPPAITGQHFTPRGQFIGAKGPSCRHSGSTSSDSDLVHLMAEYEAEGCYPTSFADEVATIEDVFIQRGTVSSNLQATSSTSQVEVGASASGLRLGDLVQKYNFISVFVYKSPISFTQAKASLFPNGVPIKDNPDPKVSSDFVPFDDSNEVHLMLAGFRNEFNGFVTSKAWTRAVGQVDQVSIVGQGILRLFSDTLSLYDPSILANGFYDASGLVTVTPGIASSTSGTDTSTSTLQKLSVYQNLFVGLDPIQIVSQLLDLVYRIDFNAEDVVADSSDFTAIHLVELQGFYNLYKLASKHQKNAPNPLSGTGGSSTSKFSYGNLFTIPPFLVSCVMALRNYNYNLTSPDAGKTAYAYATTQGANPSKLVVGSDGPDTKFPEGVASVRTTSFMEEFGGPCVQISFVAQQFDPYFKMVKTGWSNFISSLKSPHEIIDEVLKFSMLEFYERPNGRIVMRTPQYNQAARVTSSGALDSSGNLLTSSDLSMISAAYAEDGKELLSQKRGSWAVNFIANIGQGLIQPAYGNGKLMMQYGFRESTAEANPVLQPLQQINQQNSTSTTDINKLIHQYVRFLLEFENASLKSGMIATNGDPRIEVGKLFFDKTNGKIGYIVEVHKSLTVGRSYTAQLNVKFVRDATGSLDSPVDFRQLPTLEELVTSAGNIEVGAPSTPIVEFTSAPTPPVTSSSLQQITQNLVQGLSVNPFGPTPQA